MDKQHWIVSVQDSINDYSEVQGAYFDGTETQARTAFQGMPVIAKYFGDKRYQITMKANPILLQEPGV